MTEAEEILKNQGAELPEFYTQYLLGNNSKNTISIFDHKENFEIFALSDLARRVTIDNMEVLTAQMLKAYSDTLTEFMGDSTYDQDGEEFSLTRLAKSITIGFQNTKILFLDSKDNERLYVFNPDGGDVEVTDKTLNDLVPGS